MGLLGNGFRHNLTGRITVATTALDGCNASTIPASRNLTAMRRNMLQGDAGYSSKASVPDGNRNPVAWVMPSKAGGLSSRNSAGLTVSPSANGAMGLPGTGTVSFSIDFDPATGGLISSGTGAASFEVTGTATVLATRSGDGSASMSITTNTPLLGALGWVTAEGAFSVTSTMQSYARGFMTGSTVDTSTIVNANIVSVNGYSVTGNGQTGTEWGPA
jgi:hypothetical protein